MNKDAIYTNAIVLTVVAVFSVLGKLTYEHYVNPPVATVTPVAKPVAQHVNATPAATVPAVTASPLAPVTVLPQKPAGVITKPPFLYRNLLIYMVIISIIILGLIYAVKFYEIDVMSSYRGFSSRFQTAPNTGYASMTTNSVPAPLPGYA